MPGPDSLRLSCKAALLLLPLLLLLGPGTAAEPHVWTSEQTEQLNMDQVEQFWSSLTSEYGSFFPGGRTPTIAEMLRGQNGFGMKEVVGGLLSFLVHELLYNGKLLASIVILTIFSMILEQIQSAFEKNAVSKVAYAVTYMVLLIIAMNSFHVAISYAGSAISGMIHFMMAMIPLLLTLLASMGNVVSVTILHPLIIFMIHTVGTVIHVLIFPLLYLSAVLHLVSSISDKYKVTRLANLLRTVGIGVMGVMLTVFLGIISVQGATGAVADGVTLKTAKYVTGNFVPVVGRMFSDTTDTIISASLLVKNAVGLAGVAILIVMCAFPAVKILTLALIYHLTAAVMQPLGSSPITACLETIGKSMIYVFAALAVVALMFFLAVTIIIAAGNAAVMIR